MRPRCLCPLLCLLLCMLPSAARAAEVTVHDAAHLVEALKSHQPGDVIVLADGVWRDVQVRFDASGTEALPVTLRAQTPGKVILSGKSNLHIGGRWGVVEGLVFRDGGAVQVVRFMGSDRRPAEHCRLTNTAIVDYDPPDDAKSWWVLLDGRHNRVDHCRFVGKTTVGATLAVNVGREPNHHRIDRNHFMNRPPLGQNGGESIRVGSSTVSMHSSRTMIEYNLFTACDGEGEIITNKSCDNVYRHNTFIECQGALTLRHGSRCRVEANVFLGNGKRHTGGVRVIGDGHEVVSNYFENLDGTGYRAALSVMNANPEPKLHEYWRVRDVRVEGNTLVNCRQSILFGAGAGQGSRTEPPADVTLSNNLIVGEHEPLIHFDDRPVNPRYEGNTLWGAETGVEETPGFRVIDPQLRRDEAGLLRPTMRGLTAGAAALRPLGPADVGPVWMRADAVAKQAK